MSTNAELADAIVALPPPREDGRHCQVLPPIVHIVIKIATRRRAEGGITQEIFEEQIRRITREELEPKRLTLLVCDLPDGRTRFLIYEKATGIVCDRLDFASDGTFEPGDFDTTAQPLKQRPTAAA